MKNEKEGLLVKPWRKAFEFRSLIVWLLASVYLFYFAFSSGEFSAPALLAATLTSGMALIAGLKTHQVWLRRILLFESNLMFMPVEEFETRIKANPQGIYLGEGWDWTPDHTQWVYDLSRINVPELAPPKAYINLFNKFNQTQIEVLSNEDVANEEQKAINEYRKLESQAKKEEITVSELLLSKNIEPSKSKDRFRGLSWIHGMSPSKPIYFPHNDTKGNTLISGTTRSGKTVLYRVLTTQMIMNGECVIIFDPKGDLDLLALILEVCHKYGRMDDLVFFHPAFAEYSSRIDPFANFREPSELASRIAPLIPSTSTKGDPFVSFSWGVMESIFSGMDMLNIKPSLMTLRAVLEEGTEKLLVDCIIRHCQNIEVKDYDAQIKSYTTPSNPNQRNAPQGAPRTIAATKYYKEIIKPIKASTAIDGILSFFEHNRDHALKMLASLMPVLKSLTTGSLADLLSPKAHDDTDKRPIESFDQIIAQKKICYIGLDAMANLTVANNMGSLYSSDLVASAAERYKSDTTGDHTVNVLIDEASNVLNTSVIEMLNKGAGAGFRMFAATQTIPDFEDALGAVSTKDKALGNFNNLITLRVMDVSTREYIENQMGNVTVRSAQINQNFQSLGSEHNPVLYSGGYGTRTTDTDAPLISAGILNKIPDLEFIAQISAGRIVKGRLPLLVPSEGEEKITLDDLPWVKRMRRTA